MASLRSMLFAACCIAVHAPHQAAASVAVAGDEPRGRITVTIQETSIGEALSALGRTYGFEIKGALAGGNDAVSATMSGTLEQVLTRLLRNVNHVIVRSPDNRSGIEKVIITGGGRPTHPSPSQSSPDEGRSPAVQPSPPPQEEQD